MKKNEVPKKQRLIYLEVPTIEAVEKIRERMGITKSAIFEKMAREFVNRHKARKKK